MHWEFLYAVPGDLDVHKSCAGRLSSNVKLDDRWLARAEVALAETAVAVEKDHDCCETLRLNRRWLVVERDILDVSTDEMLAAAGTKRGHVDLLIGGPPCQPFSKSGYWAHGDALRLDDRDKGLPLFGWRRRYWSDNALCLLK